MASPLAGEVPVYCAMLPAAALSGSPHLFCRSHAALALMPLMHISHAEPYAGISLFAPCSYDLTAMLFAPLFGLWTDRTRRFKPQVQCRLAVPVSARFCCGRLGGLCVRPAAPAPAIARLCWLRSRSCGFMHLMMHPCLAQP